MNYFAVDLGATSGRTILATFDGKKIDMKEITRFANPMIPLGGHLYWDIHMWRNNMDLREENVDFQKWNPCAI